MTTILFDHNFRINFSCQMSRLVVLSFALACATLVTAMKQKDARDKPDEYTVVWQLGHTFTICDDCCRNSNMIRKLIVYTWP